VTEYIWGLMGNKDLIVAEWPIDQSRITDDESRIGGFDEIRNLITDIRRLRAEQGVEPAAFVEACLVGAHHQAPVQENIAIIKRLARLAELKSVDAAPEGWASTVSGTMTVAIDVAGTVDADKEKAKAEKEIAALKPYIEGTRAKLADAEFTSKAPAKVVDGMREKLAEAEAKLKALEERV
jgi:valyl-tRNA synthetase